MDLGASAPALRNNRKCSSRPQFSLLERRQIRGASSRPAGSATGPRTVLRSALGRSQARSVPMGIVSS